MYFNLHGKTDIINGGSHLETQPITTIVAQYNANVIITIRDLDIGNNNQEIIIKK